MATTNSEICLHVNTGKQNGMSLDCLRPKAKPLHRNQQINYLRIVLCYIIIWSRWSLSIWIIIILEQKYLRKMLTIFLENTSFNTKEFIYLHHFLYQYLSRRRSYSWNTLIFWKLSKDTTKCRFIFFWKYEICLFIVNKLSLYRQTKFAKHSRKKWWTEDWEWQLYKQAWSWSCQNTCAI